MRKPEIVRQVDRWLRRAIAATPVEPAGQAGQAASGDPLSIRYGGEGFVDLSVSMPSGCKDLDIYAVWLGESADTPNSALEGKSGYMPLNYAESDGEDVRIGIVPGGFTKFLVMGYDANYNKVYSWESDPWYFPENAEALPFSVTGAKICVWPDAEAFHRAREALELAQVHDTSPDIDLNPASFSTAQELNSLITGGMKESFQDWPRLGLYITYQTDRTMEEHGRWRFPDAITDTVPFTFLLTGPGFSESYYEPFFSNIQYVRNGRGAQVISLDFLASLYMRLRDAGMEGYIPGVYTLDMFVRGVKAYTMHFALR